MSSIKRMFLLTKTIIKTTDMGISFGRKKKDLNKKGTSIAGIIVLSIVYLYFSGIIFFISNEFYNILKPLNLQTAMLGYATSLFSFIIFFFGIFYIISVFYFTSDIELLLALPLNAYEIIGGKFLSVIVYEYITTGLVLIPFFVYGVLNGEGILFFLYSIIIMLLLPIIPLAITAVIIMPIMRFVKFARNKDLFSMVSGVLVMVLAFSFNFYFQSLATNETDFGSLLASSGEKLAQVASSVFPGTVFAGQSLALASNIKGFLYLILFILLCVLAFCLILVLANFLYLKAATAVSSSNASHKKLNNKDLAKNITLASSFSTYFKKEILILFRTPIFFINNILMTLIWPVIMLLLLTIGNSRPNKTSFLVISIIKNIDYSNINQLSIVLFIAFSVSILLGGMNGIASSALSREGNCFNIMKFIPMSYFSQIMAKISVGFVFGVLTVIGTLIVISFCAMPPVWLIILVLILSVLGALFTNLFGIIFELLWPKLHWDNEQKAVKQNLNVILGMFLPVGLAVPLIMIGVNIKFDFWIAFSLLLLIGIILNAVLLIILKKIVPIRMRNIVY